MDDLQQQIITITGNVVNSVINASSNQVIHSLISGDQNTKIEPKYLTQTAQHANNMGIIDLKPYFSSSPMVKTTAKGGWYIRIPIRTKVKDMSNRLYNQARQMDMDSTQSMGNLYDNVQSTSNLLSYTPKSNNLTRVSNGKNSQYFAFRTVSNKSDPMSWIINREQAQEDNLSKTMAANLQRLVNYRLNNL